MTGAEPPLFVLGVRRSGTTLLRLMLDRHPELAIPDETYFVPQLARRHRAPVDPSSFVDDLRRLERLDELGIDPAAVAGRLRPGMTVGEAIGAVFETYAAGRGKPRWGDKTPLYMRHLPLLAALWPRARFVHLIRDGRNTALAFLAVPRGIMTESWGHPRDPAGFACQWKTEILAARELGRWVGDDRYLEVRYETLVADPRGTLERVCTFAGLRFDPGMLEYAEEVDVSGKPHHLRLLQPLTPGARDWRREMTPADTASFERVAGDLLVALGYDATITTPSPAARARLAAYRAQVAAWNAAASAVQASALWRRRHRARS